MVFVLKVIAPATVWLPIKLLLLLARPVEIKIPANGLEVVVLLEVTPVRLTLVMVFPLMLETVPPVMPEKKMPWNLPVEPVSAYVPVWVLEA